METEITNILRKLLNTRVGDIGAQENALLYKKQPMI